MESGERRGRLLRGEVGEACRRWRTRTDIQERDRQNNKRKWSGTRGADESTKMKTGNLYSKRSIKCFRWLERSDR